MNNLSNKVSIVIPAYKEENDIEECLTRIISFMDVGYNYELLCVVDGRLDKTEEIARKVEKKHPNKVRVFAYDRNMGKGYAVRYGFARSKGDIVGFLDAGFDINHNAIAVLLQTMFENNADIVIGSKRHRNSKLVYPWQRKIISYGGQIVVRLLFGLKISDTQVGIKFFKREVIEELTPRLVVTDFAFDIEILAAAKYLGFDKIYEAPVELNLNYNKVSSVISKGLAKSLFKALIDTVSIFYRLKITKYYDDNSSAHWNNSPDLVLSSPN